MKLVIALTALGLLIATACGGPSSRAVAGDYGNDLPLTVDQPNLNCIGDQQTSVIWMSAGDHYYALTGFSKTYLNRHHPNLILRDVAEIQVTGRSIRPLIEQGRSLCKGG